MLKADGSNIDGGRASRHSNTDGCDFRAVFLAGDAGGGEMPPCPLKVA